MTPQTIIVVSQCSVGFVKLSVCVSAIFFDKCQSCLLITLCCRDKGFDKAIICFFLFLGGLVNSVFCWNRGCFDVIFGKSFWSLFCNLIDYLSNW